MKHDWNRFTTHPAEDLIASFGDAQILKHLNGQLELRGGTAPERQEAERWMAQFLQKPPLLTESK
jgi:hypothetical protein